MDREERIERIAQKLAADWRARAPYEALAGDLRPRDMDEACAAQSALHRRLAPERGPLAGRKIALASPVMQKMCGIDHPVAGAIFAADVRRSPAEVNLDDFRHLGVEFELALILARDVGPEEAPFDAAGARALVAEVRPAFELIEDRGADYSDLDALTLAADNAWCGGAVLGEPIPGWRARDLDDLPSTVLQEGREPERANTGAARPLASLAWVLNHFAARGETVKAGEAVITGSAARTRFPAAGDRLTYEIDGLARVEMILS
jgi:2-keto-4-pentenoate hydratase